MKDKKALVKKIMKNTNALLRVPEGELLFSLAEDLGKKGVIVEIGSYTGGSTGLLATASKLSSGNKIYAIDPHVVGTLPTFEKNMKKLGVNEWIVLIVKSSLKAIRTWKLPIQLLWIDGDHDYEYAKMDFLLWEKYLKKGGIITFHDSANDSQFLGPMRVVKEFLFDSRRFKVLGQVETITYARKIKNRTLKEKLKYFFSLQYCKILTIPKRTDQFIGRIGIYLKRKTPELYNSLKKLK